MSNITPEELSGKLDKLLPPGTQAHRDSLLPDSDPLIHAALGFAASPPPNPSHAAKARMAAKLFATVDAMPSPVLQMPKVRRVNPFRIGMMASAAAVVLMVAGLLTVLNRTDSLDLTATAPRVAVITVSPSPTVTDAPATDVIPVISLFPSTATNIPVTQVIATATEMIPTAMTPPIATASLSVPQTALFMIEGYVNEIFDDAVVIAEVRVQLNPKDPLLKTLHLGDLIRIEGVFSAETNLGHEVTFTLDQSKIIVNQPDSTLNVVEVGSKGEVWRDDGACKNAPPEWANARGWHKRCDGTNSSGNGNSNGNGNNNSGGNGSGNENGNGNSNSGGNGNKNGKNK